MRTLRHVRLQVRELTHTLHFPPAYPELYEGPRSDWLKEILERLPRLQALIVKGLPFWDHAALLALRTSSALDSDHSGNQTFNLRYLDAISCSNSTPGGLAEALRHFPALLYLDLSSVQAVRVSSVLEAIATLPGLQILKLRGLGLKDRDIEIIAKLGNMLRSLDVTDNNLTDASVRVLLDRCSKRGRLQSRTDNTYRPIGLPRHRSEENELEEFLGDYRGVRLDGRVRRQLTTGLVDSLTIEMNSNSGLTHLYISGNDLTVEGVATLLRCPGFQLLDCGDIRMTSQHNQVFPEVPEVSKIIPLVNDCVAPDLSYLRINHAIATTKYQPSPEPSARAKLPGDFMYEASQSQPPVYELEGTPVSRALGDDASLKKEVSTVHLNPPPTLKTLVLTSVPATVSTKEPINNLVNLLYRCSAQTSQAALRAASVHGLPPGKSANAAVFARHHHAKELFRLEKIVLEMQSYNSRHKKETGWRKTSHLGALEDGDVDVLWQSASADFSFFDNDEECGLPSTAQVRQRHEVREPDARIFSHTVIPGGTREARTEKPTALPPIELDTEHIELDVGVEASDYEQRAQTHDLVAQIASFRRDRKAAFEAALAADQKEDYVSSSIHGHADKSTVFVPGYWPGEIQVIR